MPQLTNGQNVTILDGAHGSRWGTDDHDVQAHVEKFGAEHWTVERDGGPVVDEDGDVRLIRQELIEGDLGALYILPEFLAREDGSKLTTTQDDLLAVIRASLNLAVAGATQSFMEDFGWAMSGLTKGDVLDAAEDGTRAAADLRAALVPFGVTTEDVDALLVRMEQERSA